MTVSDTAHPLCVGLTGGIGCGKSTVAKLFQQHGAVIIDTDEIAHQLTQSLGAAMPAIQKLFGVAYLTAEGGLNRAKMRELIFSDPVAKQKLEGLLHPLIRAQALEQLRQSARASYVIMVVPLLLQSPDFMRLVRRILVVDCDEHQQIERVMQRSNLSAAGVRSIMAQQTPRPERLRRATEVIRNDGSLDELAQQVAALHRVYFALSD